MFISKMHVIIMLLSMNGPKMGTKSLVAIVKINIIRPKPHGKSVLLAIDEIFKLKDYFSKLVANLTCTLT